MKSKYYKQLHREISEYCEFFAEVANNKPLLQTYPMRERKGSAMVKRINRYY